MMEIVVWESQEGHSVMSSTFKPTSILIMEVIRVMMAYHDIGWYNRDRVWIMSHWMYVYVRLIYCLPVVFGLCSETPLHFLWILCGHSLFLELWLDRRGGFSSQWRNLSINSVDLRLGSGSQLENTKLRDHNI